MKNAHNMLAYKIAAAVIVSLIIGFLAVVGISKYKLNKEKTDFFAKVDAIEKANLGILNNLEKTDKLNGIDLNNNLLRDDVETFINQSIKDNHAKAVANFYTLSTENMLRLFASNHAIKEEAVKIVRKTEECIIFFSMTNEDQIKNLVAKSPTVVDDFILIRQVLMKYKKEIFLNNPIRLKTFDDILLKYPYEPRKPAKQWTSAEFTQNKNFCVGLLDHSLKMGALLKVLEASGDAYLKNNKAQ